jgi:glycosyltransferase involved in cell wall biosynthesis
VISLVVATMGRVDELRALFESLLDRQEARFEVILVDQNGDARLAPVVADYAPRMPLRHLKLPRPHANAARNLGLRHARGELVGFPDDDCTLPSGTLARVRAAFDADGTLAVLTGPAAAPGGGLGSGRWRAEGGPITTGNVWTSVIEFNLWLRREVALALGGFDEAMGPGARFGSAEGNDLVCRALAAGHAARYAPELRVVHPDKRLTPEAVARAHRYGQGRRWRWRGAGCSTRAIIWRRGAAGWKGCGRRPCPLPARWRPHEDRRGHRHPRPARDPRRDAGGTRPAGACAGADRGVPRVR